MKFSAIRHADLSWNEQGTPVSQFFDDVYFSNHNGLQETRYVFIGGNHLYQRFPHHQTDLFTVAETGFGTGLNFLTLWQCFSASRQQNNTQKLQRLHMISCEQYPLTAADLAQAHLPWPELAPFATALQQQWPDAIPGCHRLLFDEGRITLDLWLGEINQLIDDFDDSLQGQVDAWFLDGFAPARNPDMWTDKLFRAMARFAKPQATFATFTAAGFVRRGLQRAGFQVTRCKGFGHKREMLTGHLPDTFAAPSPAPWYSRPATSSRNIAIIGGGIASACLALALLRRNYQVTLYCADAQAAGNASGNRQGALYPLLNPYDPNLASFFPAAFGFARRFYDSVPVVYEHDWCGVLQLGWDERSQKKIDRMLKMSLPESLACAVSRENTTALTGLAVDHGGIFYPQGGWLSPAELTTALWSLASERGAVCYWRHEVSDLQSTEPGWQLTFSDGTQTQHPELVLAAGHQINRFAASHPLPVYPVAGQVSHMASDPPLTSLRTVLCYDGYLTPVSPGQQSHCLGASYHRGSDDLNYSEYDQQMNLQRLQGCLPASEWTRSIDLQAGDARRGVRCATRDHLPMAGAVPNYSQTLEQYAQLQSRSSAPATVPPAPVWPGLYVLGALGSRGLCSAPLAAEVLAAQLCGEPQPLDRHTLNALQPSRFWIRKLLKGRAVKPPTP